MISRWVTDSDIVTSCRGENTYIRLVFPHKQIITPIGEWMGTLSRCVLTFLLSNPPVGVGRYSLNIVSDESNQCAGGADQRHRPPVGKGKPSCRGGKPPCQGEWCRLGGEWYGWVEMGRVTQGHRPPVGRESSHVARPPVGREMRTRIDACIVYRKAFLLASRPQGPPMRPLLLSHARS